MINKRTVALAKMANVNERECTDNTYTLTEEIVLGWLYEPSWWWRICLFFLVENEQFGVTTSEGDRCQWAYRKAGHSLPVQTTSQHRPPVSFPADRPTLLSSLLRGIWDSAINLSDDGGPVPEHLFRPLSCWMISGCHTTSIEMHLCSCLCTCLHMYFALPDGFFLSLSYSPVVCICESFASTSEDSCYVIILARFFEVATQT